MNKAIMAGLGLLGLLLLVLGVPFYADLLWFEKLGFSSVFWTMVLSKFGTALSVWLVFVLVVFLNLYVARRLFGTNAAGHAQAPFSSLRISGKGLNILLVLFVLAISLIVASNGYSRWEMILRYIFQQPFGSQDPIFGKEIGFYLFSLPFYLFAQRWLLGFILFAGLLTVWWYLKEGAIHISERPGPGPMEGLPGLPAMDMASKPMKHLCFLGGAIFLVLAWDYLLKMYELLYSTQGSAFGAGYTDVTVQILAYKILILLSLGMAVLLFVNLFNLRIKLILKGGAIWIGGAIVLTGILPALVQKFVVKPNELAKEGLYIAYNIDHTREAYNLERTKEVSFSVNDDLTMDDIKKNSVTIQNIKIWDERLLLQTYKQLQSIRLYYDFNNVDVDRYPINGEYRQVMLAARELVVDQLPPQANTWVNRHLIYTHGYGLTLSPVNQVTSEGLPLLLIKDLPPAFGADLRLDRPEIYYGEKTDEYVLVKTEAKEFDYPKGDKNVYATYQGRGGVPIDSLLKRLLFALEFRDPQILFTGYLTPDSRIMYNRRIDRRIDLLAPFLDYDGDPYLTIVGGKLYWIQDAYTTSNMYPYSTRSKVDYERFRNKELNYVRNSVKVVVDAYDGDVSLYLVDQKDPIAGTYSAIFPTLFKSFEDMLEGLKEHLRYPKDLFEIQANTYRIYHMKDVQVFYNQEDLWQIPNELYADVKQEMKAYYIIIRLPEENKEEFLLMLPYTPSEKDNMIGWLAARSDLPNYGTLLAYKLPKEKLVFGPIQIEARVDQQTDISREFTLWGQRGSQVIRGNLLAIPVQSSFIYVEPVYLEARQAESVVPAAGARPFGGLQRRRAAVESEPATSRGTALPELKRVIVAFGNRLLMKESLDDALRGIFGGEKMPQVVVSQSEAQTNIHALVQEALEHYNDARDNMRQGNWAEYGRKIEQLEEVLIEMSTISGGKK